MHRKLLLIILILIGGFCLGTSEVKALDTSYGFTYSLAKDADDCDGIFDDEVIDFLQQMFNIFKYAAPLLCLALSITDFIKATASQDKEALMKAVKMTGKRIMYALILFFIPTLINFLFDLLGWYGTCGIS